MKILLVDDHALFRAGMRMLLATLQSDLTILEAGSCAAALALARTHPDIRLCLLDLFLREEHGLSALSAIKEASPGLAAVVVSSDESADSVMRALDEGAMGYVPKSATPQAMTEALKLVLSGGIYLPPALEDRRGARSAMPELTERQADVLRCLLRGWPNKLISRHLGLSDNTIKSHLSAVYRALDVTSRSQAVIAASRLGFRPELGIPGQDAARNG